MKALPFLILLCACSPAAGKIQTIEGIEEQESQNETTEETNQTEETTEEETNQNDPEEKPDEEEWDEEKPDDDEEEDEDIDEDGEESLAGSFVAEFEFRNLKIVLNYLFAFFHKLRCFLNRYW